MHTTPRSALISQGMAAKAEAGFLPGKARLGYRNRRTEDGSVAAPDFTAALALGEAFQRVASGESLRAVLGWLRDRNIAGARGNPISLSTLQRILADPYYAGLVKDENGKLVPGGHPPLVDLELFLKAQRGLAKRRTSPSRPTPMTPRTVIPRPGRPASVPC